MALYLNTCISSGELRTSSWRRRQRRQARSSCCSRASWGASCLGHRHTNTRAQNIVTVVLAQGQSPRWSSWLCFRDDGTDNLPAAPCAPQKSQGPEGPQVLQQRTSCSLSCCLFGRRPLVPEPPPTRPWREQASLGGHFHGGSMQPFPALSFCTGWGRSFHLPPIFPALSFVKGCLQWSLLIQPR